MYNAKHTKFEIQCVAFGILRKNLFPKFLVRGDFHHNDIHYDVAVFKANGYEQPQLKLAVVVGERQDNHLLLPCEVVYVTDMQEAYKILGKAVMSLT